jgi:uncharacterized protein (TIGR04255 family)
MITKESRNTYKNPQIVEAAIEIRFVKAIENTKIQHVLQGQGHCRLEELVSFTAQPGPEGMAVARNQTQQFRLHFSITKNLTAFVYSDKISFHWQGKYAGWDVFQAAFKSFWMKLLEVTQEIVIGRVGVRYINLVNEKRSDQEVGHWLKSTANYPAGLLSSKNGYFYSIRRPLELKRQMQLFVAEGELRNGTDGPLILDIDVQSDNATQQTSSQSNLLVLIDELHEEVLRIFKDSITQNYLNLLNKDVS